MNVDEFSIRELAIRIAGDDVDVQDIGGWFYRSGRDLVNLFNDVGFRDIYGPGFPSRKVYIEEKLSELNRTGKLKNFINLLLKKDDGRGMKQQFILPEKI